MSNHIDSIGNVTIYAYNKLDLNNGGKRDTDDELSIVAKKRMDIISNLQFSINDYLIPLDENDRVSSSPFDAYLPPDNIFNVQGGGFRRLVSDGYWVFLKPLKSDSLIKSYGSCS